MWLILPPCACVSVNKGKNLKVTNGLVIASMAHSADIGSVMLRPDEAIAGGYGMPDEP